MGPVYKVFLFFLDVQLASLTTIRKVQRRGDSFQTQEKKFKLLKNGSPLCTDNQKSSSPLIQKITSSDLKILILGNSFNSKW